MYLGVVLNPLARKNRASAEHLARIERVVGPWGEVVQTDSLAALRPAVERLAPKVTHFVSDGGDGALHWLLNEVRAVLGPDSGRWPAFVPTNGGTIDFVAHKAGVRGRSEAILRALAGAAAAKRPPAEVRLDSMHVTGVHEDGRPFDRIGFALAAGGVGLRFFDKYYEDPSPSPMTIVRVIARTVSDFALEKLGKAPNGRPSYAAHLFRPTRARVVIDGEELPYRTHGGIHAAAFDVNLGGVLRVFPFAREPGVLHFQAGDIRPVEMIANLPALVVGGAVRAPGLRDCAGTRMEVEAEGGESLALVIDGERFEALRRIEVRPGPPIRVAHVRA
ncbi:MAG TPA: hypothetical protein VIL20_20435 [Sandaracinaceae bacterium]